MAHGHRRAGKSDLSYNGGMTNVVNFKSNSVRAQLRAAQTSGELVRLWRNGLEAGSFARNRGSEYSSLTPERGARLRRCSEPESGNCTLTH